MSLAKIFDYFSTYRPSASDFEVFSARGDEATEFDVGAFEKKIGFRLPDEFREFSMSYLGGLYMFAKEEIWPVPKAGEVAPYWSFLRGLIVFGLSKKAPDEIHMNSRLEEFENNFGKNKLVPFMKLFGSADRYCFDHEGHIFEFQHDDVARPHLIEESFSVLLMREINELIERTNRKKAE
ncbi:MAG: SMI1/KNR4 family protein [Verrucomicrobiaceae bacterium]